MSLRGIREFFEGLRLSLGLSSRRWEYGHIASGSRARRHRLTGRVEFELWPAGHERGYPDRPFWHVVGYGHEATFVADKEQP